MQIKFTRKKIIGIAFACLVALAAIFCVAVFSDFSSTENITPAAEQPGALLYAVDSVDMDTYILISGWVLMPGEDIETVDSHFVLHNTSNGEYIQILSAANERLDLEQNFGTGYHYDRAGLAGKVSSNKIDLNDVYEICIAYGNNGHDIFVHTSTQFGGASG